MTRRRRSWLAAIGVACVTVLVPQVASAATFNVPCGDVAQLRQAITDANATAAQDTIEVTGAPCNFDVPNAAVVGAGGNNSGLPVVTQPLVVEGNGATIRRTGTDNYRLLVTAAALELRELTISNGRLTGSNYGAGIAGFLADVTLDRVILTSNVTTNFGGGVGVLGGSLTMDRSVAAFNQAAAGAAVSTNQTATVNRIRRSSIYFNAATSNTSVLVQNSSAEIENSTIAVNLAPSAIGGVTAWGEAAGMPASVTVRSSTLGDNGQQNNTAPGTSLWALSQASPATIDVVGSVVADTDSQAPPLSPPCRIDGGAITSGGGNVEWPTSTCGFETEADPMLGYQFDGLAGIELFAQLLPGSAAIDAGGDLCPAVDQRGEPRPAGLACDSGSWEVQPPNTTAVGPPSPTNEPIVTFESDQPDSTFECSVDAGEWQPCESPFDPHPLEDGEHTVDVRATNADGHVDPTPASVTFVYDGTPPEVLIDPVTSPADPVVEITFTINDESEITEVTCQVDDGEPVPCTSPFETEELSDGDHTVTVTATDAAGNVGSSSVTFHVGEFPPDEHDAVCTQSTLLLGSNCMVVFECPPEGSGCTARGTVNVQANRITGIVRGEVDVRTPPSTLAASATCGFPQALVSECAAQTGPIPVEPGETVHVQCFSNRGLSLGVLILDLDCRGEFTTPGGPPPEPEPPGEGE